MATLMFWNKQNGHDNKSGKKNWLHAPDNLVDGHIVYRAKFLGKCAVDQPKGIEVVKDAIRKLQLSQQMKKFENQVKKQDQNNSWKAKKVELSVSINGVAVRDTQSQMIMHQYPLYRISYCADEKGEKKYFSFIAKSAEGSGSDGGGAGGVPPPGNDSVVPNMNDKEKHECFVFISSKNASDITLTIGQAFDLAYTKYKTDSEKTSEAGALQAKNSSLEKTVVIYRQRLRELSEHIPRAELEQLMQRMGIKDLFEVPQENGVEVPPTNGQQLSMMSMNRSSSDSGNLLSIDSNDDLKCPPVPSRTLPGLDVFKNGTNGSKNDELLLNSDSDSDFDPRAFEDDNKTTTNDFFGFEPTKTLGQQIFSATNSHHNFVNNMNAVNVSVTNGFDTNNNNSSSHNGAVPAPLLAPPPKAGTQRRSGGPPQQQAPILNNGKIMDNQDLFGSTPFHTAPISFESSSSSSSLSAAFPIMSLPKEGTQDSASIGSTASGQSLDRHQNPFQFFDRIDQEIEENKQRLKEAIPVTRAQNSQVYANGPLDAPYSQAKQGAGYNAFFNIHFDQFSMKSPSNSPIATTTNKTKTNGYNAFSNEAATIPNPSTGHKKASDLQQNLIWG